jgi:hypothetical protein
LLSAVSWARFSFNLPPTLEGFRSLLIERILADG